ncbi:hypothetical protein CBS14141_003783 [Malassezia furfur]|nr:hypothetical protein CBS14141_003783 [Malassezia furfur]
MPVRSRPLPTPAGPLHASPSAYDVYRTTPETPPPVPAKPGRDSPGAALSRSASVRQQAELLMQRGSPSRAGHRRTQSPPTRGPCRPRRCRSRTRGASKTHRCPCRRRRQHRCRRHVESGGGQAGLVTHTHEPTAAADRARAATAEPTRARRKRRRSTHVADRARCIAQRAWVAGRARRISRARRIARAARTASLPSLPALPPRPAPRVAPTSPLARRPPAAHPFSPPPRSPHVHAHAPVAPRATSPLRHAQPVPSTDDVFGPRAGAANAAPLVAARPEPRRPAAQRAPPRVGGARAPESPAAARPFVARPLTPPATLAEPARPETPTRSRTPEGRVPRIARTPSPVRSARPYEMVPAVPGGPPVPLLLIEGEELTDALMDPAADVGDATVSFDESSGALPQHASRARAADDARWPDADDVSDDDAALASAVRCAGCQRGIVGALVHAMDAAWHARCFVCAACATPLEHVSFYAHDGRPYCHLDYHERFARRCFYCETPIIDERFVTIDDARLGQRSYHELHFFCAGCGDPFFEPRDAPSPGGGRAERARGRQAVLCARRPPLLRRGTSRC